MVDFNKIRRIQFGSHLLMYGVVAVAVHHLEDTPEVSVLAIPDGYGGDRQDYPISEEQYLNLISSLVVTLQSGLLPESEIEDDGCLPCDAFIEDFDGNTEEYESTENLQVETYKDLCRTVNEIINCPVISDLLEWI